MISEADSCSGLLLTGTDGGRHLGTELRITPFPAFTGRQLGQEHTGGHDDITL